MHVLTTLHPIRLKQWIIQGSIFNNQTICLVFFDPSTTRTIVRFFDDDDQAHTFVSYITE